METGTCCAAGTAQCSDLGPLRASRDSGGGMPQNGCQAFRHCPRSPQAGSATKAIDAAMPGTRILQGGACKTL